MGLCKGKSRVVHTGNCHDFHHRPSRCRCLPLLSPKHSLSPVGSARAIRLSSSILQGGAPPRLPSIDIKETKFSNSLLKESGSAPKLFLLFTTFMLDRREASVNDSFSDLTEPCVIAAVSPGQQVIIYQGNQSEVQVACGGQFHRMWQQSLVFLVIQGPFVQNNPSRADVY